MSRILVIGETCTDRFVWCQALRLSPEAPVPVLNPLRTTENLGMAANVRANLVSLGATSVDLICQTLDITKTRYVDEQSGYIVVRVDERDKADAIDPQWMACKLREQQWDAVVVSDYNKGALSERALQALFEYTRSMGIASFMDTKKLLGAWSAAADFVKLNAKEHELHTRAGLRAEELCRNLIVTRGSEGAEWVGYNVTVATAPIAVRDVSGAGDSWLAAFVLRWLKNGEQVADAMEYANRVARVAVSKHGVVAVRREEVV